MLAVDPGGPAAAASAGRSSRRAIDRPAPTAGPAIAIYTRPSMTAAQRLYASLGFEREPDRDWEFEPGEWLLASAAVVSPRPARRAGRTRVARPAGAPIPAATVVLLRPGRGRRRRCC